MKWYLLVLTAVLLAFGTQASVIYVSGDQAGIWSADTVIVTGEVRVPPGQSLTVMPGVEVLFSVYCKLIVDSAATLRAIGTPADSIRFDVLPPDSSWHGIRFLSASDSSRLEYCILMHGSTSGYFSPDNSGGAIYCSNSSPMIYQNTISENHAVRGGGICCEDNSNSTIYGNMISNNSCLMSVPFGGGIYCTGSNPSIINNIITGNRVQGIRNADGGGIACHVSNPTISGNIICYNTASNVGGGILCGYNSNAIINGNTIYGNTTWWGGGGIYSQGGSFTLVNCILWGNSSPQIFAPSGSLQVTYSDIQGGWTGIGNIDTDPLFVNPDSGDFHLKSAMGSYHNGQWLPDPLHSPCIDTGDPSSPFAMEPTPNGGRINMGFEGNTEEASLSMITSVPLSEEEIPEGFGLYAPYPNPFNPTTVLSYQLPVASHVNLRIYDTVGRLVVTLVDGMREAGTHEVTFDGSKLASGVYLYKLIARNFMVTEKMILMK